MGAIQGGSPAPDDDSAVLGTNLVQDRQGWWVELVVGFGGDAAEVVSNRIGPYLTEKQAQTAAHFIARAAGRTAGPPTGF